MQGFSKAISMYDFAIIGGGIVGLATGAALGRRYPFARILLVEKEAAFAQHQTGRNSGVIHSGIYYKPGSLKAEMAQAGNQSMRAFCYEYGVPFDICGKLIVATSPEEIPQLNNIYDRALQNGVPAMRLTPEEVREISRTNGTAGKQWTSSMRHVDETSSCPKTSAMRVEAPRGT